MAAAPEERGAAGEGKAEGSGRSESKGGGQGWERSRPESQRPPPERCVTAGSLRAAQGCAAEDGSAARPELQEEPCEAGAALLIPVSVPVLPGGEVGDS